MVNTIFSAVATILVVTLILVALLLVIKAKLTPSGNVTLDINNGKKMLDVPQGGDLMHTLADQGISFPPLAAARPTAASARSASWKAAAKSSPPRPVSSPANRSRTTGASAARSRSRTTSRSRFPSLP